MTSHTAATEANQPNSQPGAIAPPPLLALDVVVPVVAVLDAAVTVRVVLVVSDLPALSVTVRLTVTLPAAVGSRVAVDAVVELVMLAMLPPLVIAHWYALIVLPVLALELDPSSVTVVPATTLVELTLMLAVAVVAATAVTAAPASSRPAPQVLVVQ